MISENKFNENIMKIKISVPIPLKTKMLIPLTFHKIDFGWVEKNKKYYGNIV